LYRNQLDTLREHYGRRYESVLDSTKDQQTWTEEAARVTDSFRAAAQHAIPAMCREGGELVDADFSYVQSLHGLLSDMMEATESRSELSDILEEMENAPEDEGAVRKKPAKWYEKLAARAFVLGFNYLQGWLAWQGVRRAAAERDRDMPKFPLF
jgi:predicted phage gp36 major capsid-like protein